MAEDDRVMRELYSEATAGRRTDHPDDAAWEAFALGELPRSNKERLLDHVARCADCAQIYRGLKMLAAEAAEFDPAVPRTAIRRRLAWPKPWIYGGLAAAAAVVLVTLLPVQPGNSPVAVPTPSEDPLRSPVKAAPVPLEPAGKLTHGPRAFRWSPIPGASRYRIELSSREGDLLWASPPVEGTTVEWPAAVPPAPGVYYWLVTALPDADRPLSVPAASALVSFEIAAPDPERTRF